MADIRTILNKILSASLGRDVRQAIHDGIETCYADGKAGAIDLIARQEIDQLDSTKADKTEVTTPFNFKGSCTFANLPTSANVNDTWYVTDKKCRYTWNGSTWYQSSLNESDYTDELNGLKSDTGELKSDLDDQKYLSRHMLTAYDYLTIEGKDIRFDGSLGDSANHIASDYIKVNKGDVLHWKLRGSNSSTILVCAYKPDKTLYGRAANGAGPLTDVEETWQINIDGYIRICNRYDFDDAVFEINGSGNLIGIKKIFNKIHFEIQNEIQNEIEEETNNKIIFNGIPSYWTEHISNAINRYNEKSELIGSHGVSFGFVSDTHWSANDGYSAKILSYICRNTSMDIVVHGGDFVKTGQDDVNNFTIQIDKNIKFLPVIGNHEYDGSIPTMTIDSIYAYAFRRSEHLFTHINGFNYCFDNEAQKVRFICLDYNDSNKLSLLETWVNELESGWNVIVLCHMYWQGATRGNEPTITEEGVAIASKIDELNRTASSKIILYLCGHVHRDMNTTTTDGVPIISINCDAYPDYLSYDWGGYKMYSGETTSQCIDLINIDTVAKKIYLTRIGVGDDREFTY